ncbi:alpha/beta fold hydrolase [Actinomadura macra]|uniref:alpha/beta fold hydrolase n=1 Tax=Actinomadura macra TaxID=46164 RepID=UPI000B0C03DA|nr:alpha/beta hydrolase [Actinomadura macra]
MTSTAGTPEPAPAAISGTAHYFPLWGRTAFAESYGAGEPILCVHSAGQSGAQWRAAVGGLAARGYRAVVVDLPGHGRSEMLDAGPVTDLGVYAQWCVEVIDHFRLADPYVVGCSIGGKIALDIGTRIPNRLAGIVAMAADARNDGQNEAGLNRALHDTVSPSRSDRTYYGTLAACGAAVPGARAEIIARMHRREDPQVSTSDLIGWARHDLRDRLARITCPCHVVVGADDFWMDADSAERTAAAIPGSGFTVLDGIGHYPMEELDDFAAVLDDWLHPGSPPDLT